MPAQEHHPYYFSDVPKLSKASVLAYHWLLNHVHHLRVPTQLTNQIDACLEEITKIKVRTTISETHIANLQKTKPAAASVCTLLRPLSNHHALLLLDLISARTLISGLLGLKPPQESDLFLSELEKGIYEFLIAKLIKNLLDKIPIDTLSKIQVLETYSISRSEPLNHHSFSSSVLLAIQFDIQFPSHTGQGSILVDLRTAEQAIPFSKPTKNVNLQEGLARVAHLQVPIFAHIGQIPLSLEDVRNLEADDIVILENSSLKLKETGLSGDIQCQIGHEKAGILIGKIFLTQKGKYAIQITDLIPTASTKSTERTLL